jgi:hypothetical protein
MRDQLKKMISTISRTQRGMLWRGGVGEKRELTPSS